MKVASVLFALVIAAAPAAAGKLAGVTLPDTLSIGGQELALNGMGVREVSLMKVDVYVAGLYVAQPSANPATLLAADQPKVLVVRFMRDVGREDIQKAWREGLERNAAGQLAAIKPHLDQLNAWMPSFAEGDTLVFTYAPGGGVAVDINQQRKGVIQDPGFARALFSIWLGPNPPTTALKRGLLGANRG